MSDERIELHTLESKNTFVHTTLRDIQALRSVEKSSPYFTESNNVSTTDSNRALLPLYPTKPRGRSHDPRTPLSVHDALGSLPPFTRSRLKFLS